MKIRTISDFTDDSDAALWREELRAVLTVEDWHEVGDTNEPAFENSWVNFGSGYETAAFYKDPFGVVHIKGLVKSGTGLVTNVFTLPAGYRPSVVLYFPTASNSAFGMATLLANGSVRLDIGSTTWVSLDGISFRV